MVPLSNYRNMWSFLAGVIPGINHCLVVHDESDLASMIREIDDGDVILIAVIPSSDIEATSSDDYEEIESCFAFIVKKSDRGNLTQSEYLDQIGQMQTIMSALKKKLIDLSEDYDHTTPYSHILHGLFINGMHTDPEYNLLGCNGWGLSFKLKTAGV